MWHFSIGLWPPSRIMSHLPLPSSPFLNPTEKFLPLWAGKCMTTSHDRMSPLDAMNAGYLEGSTDGCQGMKQACKLFVFQSGRTVRCNIDVNRLSALLYFYWIWFLDCVTGIALVLFCGCWIAQCTDVREPKMCGNICSLRRYIGW